MLVRFWSVYTCFLLLTPGLVFILLFVQFSLEDTFLLLPVLLHLDCLCFGLFCQLSLFAQLCFQFCDFLLQRLFRVALVSGSF